LPNTLDPRDAASQRDHHAACIRKVSDHWFIIDSAEPEPIDLHIWIDAVKWISAIEYIDVYEFHEEKLNEHELEQLSEEWYRFIIEGDYSKKPCGGNKKQPKNAKVRGISEGN
jgi:hypothetical protein